MKPGESASRKDGAKPSIRTEFVPSWNDWDGAVCVTLEDHERELARVLSERGRSEYSAWLIEIQSNGLTMWWAEGEPWVNYGEPIWTRDAYKAIQFTREQDARAAMKSWPAWMHRTTKVTGHLFNIAEPQPAERPGT